MDEISLIGQREDRSDGFLDIWITPESPRSMDEDQTMKTAVRTPVHPDASSSRRGESSMTVSGKAPRALALAGLRRALHVHGVKSRLNSPRMAA